MRNTEYHIKKINADLNPVLGETSYASTHLKFEMGEGTYNDEEDLLTTDATLELKLFSKEDYEEDKDEDEELKVPSYGSIEIEMALYAGNVSEFLEGDVDIEAQMAIWKDDGYEHMHKGLIASIETGILSEIISPIDHLLDDSFSGILPMFIFTSSPDDGTDTEDDDSGEDDDE